MCWMQQLSLADCARVSGAGEDVCREVSAVADQVIVAARSWKNPEWASDPRPFGPCGNVSRRGMVSTLHPDGRVEFTQVMVAQPQSRRHAARVALAGLGKLVKAQPGFYLPGASGD